MAIAPLSPPAKLAKTGSNACRSGPGRKALNIKKPTLISAKRCTLNARGSPAEITCTFATARPCLETFHSLAIAQAREQWIHPVCLINRGIQGVEGAVKIGIQERNAALMSYTQ